MLTNKRCILWLLLAFLSGDSSADWLQFRGPEGRSRTDTECPTEFGGESNRNFAWKIGLPGRAVNGPIVVGDQVIATASSGTGQKRLHVTSVDDETGEIQWDRRFWATGRTLCHPLSAVAAATPSSDGQRIFALFSSNDLFCLGLNGDLLWTRALTVEFENAFDDRGLASSTWLSGQTLIVQVACSGDSFVMGVEPATGKTKWKMPLARDTNWATPCDITIRGKSMVMIQSAERLLIVDPKDGTIHHTFESKGNYIPSPTVAGSTILMPANGLTAITFSEDEEAGEELWRSQKVSAESASPVAIDDDTFLVVRGSGVVTAAAVADGKVRWQERMKGNGFWATPLVSKDYAYVTNTDGLVYVFALTDGEVVAKNELGEEVLGSPAAHDDSLYFRTTSSLIKVSKKAA